MNDKQPSMRRGLSTRHIRFMALGSAIGTGLLQRSNWPALRSCWPT